MPRRKKNGIPTKPRVVYCLRKLREEIEKVDGRSKNIRQLLDGNFFSIPEYQRPFSWTEAQVRELFEDIENFYIQNKKSVEEQEPINYYLGSIVIIEQGGAETSVVDGQQRLTTTVCLLRAMYYFYYRYRDQQAISDSAWDLIRRLIARSDGYAYKVPVALGNNEAQEFFEKTVLSGFRDGSFREVKDFWDSGDGQQAVARKNHPARRLKDATRLCFELIRRSLKAEKGKAAKAEKLLGLAQVLTNHFTVFQLTMEDEDQAYEYFEGLNDRGLALGIADLIKNRCLSDANRKGAKVRVKVSQEWDTIYSVFLDNSNIAFGLDDFLHYSWLSREDAITKKTGFFKGFKRSAKDPRTYVDDLSTDVLHIDDFFTDSRGATETDNQLADLCYHMTVKMAFVALLEGRRTYAGPEWAEFVKTIHAFCVRWKVMDAGQPVITSSMHAVAKMVRKGETMQAIRKFLAKNVPDNQFKESLLRYSKKQAKFAYLLVYWMEYEMHRSAQSGTVPLRHGQNQLEHIMPKTPKKTNWPAATKLKTRDPDGFTEKLWLLGNMAPLPQPTNGSLGNKPIDAKAAEYSKTTLKSYSPENFTDFLQNGKWTDDSIENRTKHLVENWACIAFALS